MKEEFFKQIRRARKSYYDLIFSGLNPNPLFEERESEQDDIDDRDFFDRKEEKFFQERTSIMEETQKRDIRTELSRKFDAFISWIAFLFDFSGI